MIFTVLEHLVHGTIQRMTMFWKEARCGRDLWATVPGSSVLSHRSYSFSCMFVLEASLWGKDIHRLQRQLKALSNSPCYGLNICLKIHTVRLNSQCDARKMWVFGGGDALVVAPQSEPSSLIMKALIRLKMAQLFLICSPGGRKKSPSMWRPSAWRLCGCLAFSLPASRIAKN